jgi:Protein of unknown function (DUF3089)
MTRVIVCAAFAVGACAQTPAANDYSNPKTWLCRPGQHDACDVDLSTTVVADGGKMTREEWKADPRAPIDCFYVYPTVSTDPTPNSDMTPDAAELNTIRLQFARFGSKCRTYAPVYRQITLAGLRLLLAGRGGGLSLDNPFTRGLQYDDVRDAWRYYLEHDNLGRGFVLIGHSQGSFILAELIRQEIDGKPVQARMLSAILPGATLAVPKGKDVGGAFQHTPLCRSASQTGCVVAYSSFRSTAPPPANTRFGKVANAEQSAACTNPAALGGGSEELRAYFSTDSRTIVGGSQAKPWITSGQRIDTPFVSIPGMLTARCMSNEYATYLEVSVHPDPSGKRTDDIPGDLATNGQVLQDWGLHLVDVDLATGNLLDIVDQEAKAWTKRK